MPKVKDIVKKDGKKKTKIKVGDLMGKVRERVHEARVKKACAMLEKKYSQLADAEQVVRKINRQLNEIRNMDIADIELGKHEY